MLCHAGCHLLAWCAHITCMHSSASINLDEHNVGTHCFSLLTEGYIHATALIWQAQSASSSLSAIPVSNALCAAFSVGGNTMIGDCVLQHALVAGNLGTVCCNWILKRQHTFRDPSAQHCSCDVLQAAICGNSQHNIPAQQWQLCRLLKCILKQCRDAIKEQIGVVCCNTCLSAPTLSIATKWQQGFQRELSQLSLLVTQPASAGSARPCASLQAMPDDLRCRCSCFESAACATPLSSLLG